MEYGQQNQSQANVQSILKNGTQYIPLASLVQQLGGTIDWNHQATRASLQVRGHTAEVDMNDNSIMVDGQARTLNARPIIEGDRVYVTPDFMDQLGLTHN
jgi:hypothetical protein